MTFRFYRSLFLIFSSLSLLGLLGLAAYAGYRLAWHDAYIPDFARRPYEPFSREDAVAIAEREWRLFGQPVYDEAPYAGGERPKAERLPGLWQRVGEYWWIGLDADNPQRGLTGRHDGQGALFPPEEDGRHAWSAAFISYVMRMAGARARFPYSQRHSAYINAAREASLGQTERWALRAEPPESYAPQPGDLICYGRNQGRALQFDSLPFDPFGSHCDLVVSTSTEALRVIGGNTGDAVAMKHVPVTPEGKLAGSDQLPVDSRYSWFVVLRVLYD